MSSKIAITGAYGSGKTALSLALSHLTGIPRTQGTPMREPIGGEGHSVHNWTDGEVLQLTVNRYAERLLGEQACATGFISDGSVLHEWVYAKLRLVVGSYPGTAQDLRRRYRNEVTRAYEDVADHIGRLAARHAKRTYQHFVHLPIEFGLAEDNRPVNEAFRSLSDELMLPALHESGIPVHTVTGPLAERLEKVVALTGLTPVMDIEEAIRAAHS
ncbi:AAA family ATPase [Streptomyces hundungensis]|uniref:AAA family ATPase n=1 Tax=Streptomyces hundungensis TaxID=1077946 RepID=UPI0033FB692A